MLAQSVPYIIVAAVALVLIAATVVLARLAWRRQVRSYTVGLMGRREAIGAALKTIESVIGTLAQGSVPELLSFTAEGSEERRAVSEIGDRMKIEVAELADLALPKKLWPLANALGAAASALGEESGRVGEAEAEAALDALASLDLGGVRTALDEADGYISAVSTEYDLTDPSVYGGGLYI